AHFEEVEPGLQRVRQLPLGDVEVARERSAALTRARARRQAQDGLAGQARVASEEVVPVLRVGATRGNQGGARDDDSAKQCVFHDRSAPFPKRLYSNVTTRPGAPACPRQALTTFNCIDPLNF